MHLNRSSKHQVHRQYFIYIILLSVCSQEKLYKLFILSAVCIMHFVIFTEKITRTGRMFWQNDKLTDRQRICYNPFSKAKL